MKSSVDFNPIALNYNSNGRLSTQLPQGPMSDLYNLHLWVNIIDDTNGVTQFKLSSPVQVTPSPTQVLSNLTRSILNNDPMSEYLWLINSGNLNLIASKLTSLIGSFNMENNVTQMNLDQINAQSEFLEFLLNKINLLSLSDASEMKVMGSCLSQLTTEPMFVSIQMAVTLKKKLVNL